MDAAPLAKLENYLAENPPRTIPPDLVKHAGRELGLLHTTRAAIFWLLIVAAFWAAGIIMVPWGYPVEAAIRLGWHETAPAVVTKRNKTSSSVGGNKKRRQPGVPVYAVHFLVQTQAGKPAEAVNYYTGLTGMPGEAEGVYAADGKAVRDFTVEARYLPFAPASALLPQGRLSLFPPLAALVAIFPIGATLITLAFLKKRSRFFALLRDGELADAEVVDCQKTGLVVNGQARYKVNLNLAGPAGHSEAAVFAYGRQGELYQRLSQEKGKAKVLWLPYDASTVTLIGDVVDAPKAIP